MLGSVSPLLLLVSGLTFYTAESSLLVACSTAQEKKIDMKYFGFSLEMSWSDALAIAQKMDGFNQRTPFVAHASGEVLGVPATWTWRGDEQAGTLMEMEVVFRPSGDDAGIPNFPITKQLVAESGEPVRRDEKIWWWAEGTEEVRLRRTEAFSKGASSPTVQYSFFATRVRAAK